MISFAIAAALLAGFVSISTRDAATEVMVATKCTGRDPCPVCTTCEKCGHCSSGGRCGACKTTKKLLAINVCD